MLELQDIGSRQPSMESLNGPPDESHLHPGHQYSSRRSPSLRYVSTIFTPRIHRFHEFSFTDDRDRRLPEHQVRDAAAIYIHIMTSDFPILCQMWWKLWKKSVDIVGTVPMADILEVQIHSNYIAQTLNCSKLFETLNCFQFCFFLLSTFIWALYFCQNVWFF